MPLAACTSPADSQTGRHGGREAGRQEGREGVTQTTIKLTSHAAHKPDGFISPNMHSLVYSIKTADDEVLQRVSISCLRKLSHKKLLN